MDIEKLAIIKHIPHASLEIPKEIAEALLLNAESDFQRYNLTMSDVGVDLLTSDVPGILVKAKYSRLFCDVERFKDDDKEPMAKLGQGYVYSKYYDGKDIFDIASSNFLEKRKELASRYYDDYHRRFNEIVREQIEQDKDVLILDIHSYSDLLADSLGKKGPYPDICIGVNDTHITKPLLDLVISKIKAKGLSYQINYPYSGSIIPNDVLNGQIKGNVYSIMIEINKRLYL